MNEKKSNLKVIKGPTEEKTVTEGKAQNAKKEVVEKKEEPSILITPRMLPVNGRIIAQPFKRPDFETESKIILPAHMAQAGKSNKELAEMNPLYGYVFLVVSIAPRMDKEMPLPSFYYHPTKRHYNTKLQVGDQIILSDRFEPIQLREDDNWYIIVHHMDVLSVEKSPQNMHDAVQK